MTNSTSEHHLFDIKVAALTEPVSIESDYDRMAAIFNFLDAQPQTKIDNIIFMFVSGFKGRQAVLKVDITSVIEDGDHINVSALKALVEKIDELHKVESLALIFHFRHHEDDYRSLAIMQTKTGMNEPGEVLFDKDNDQFKIKQVNVSGPNAPKDVFEFLIPVSPQLLN